MTGYSAHKPQIRKPDHNMPIYYYHHIHQNIID